MRRLAALALAIATLASMVPALTAPSDANAAVASGSVATEETTVASFDGHEVPVKLYEAVGEGPAPTLLWGHGWAGSYADSTGDGEYFAERGYNVVAIDFRGHGEARQDSQARVHSPDYEIRDVRHVVDWIANASWAQTEAEPAPGRATPDPVLGAIGGSYGGGYQLLTAAVDERLDAIAPEITWNSLPQSLAPDGAIKSTWVDLLYGAGTAQASLAPFIHQGYAWATAANEFPDGELPGEPDLEGNFEASSPASYPDAVDVPTLLIQGMPDALFPLNQALANAEQIRDAGSPEVDVVTHLGGHVVNTDGTLGADDVQIGIQQGAGDSPCGDERELVHRWFDDHLEDGADDGIARAEVALADGTCLTGDAVTRALYGESPASTSAVDDVVLTQGVASGDAQAEATEARAPSPVHRTVLDADSEATVVGVPTLSGEITVAGSQAIVYASLVLDDGDSQQVVHDQVAALRVEGPVEDEAFELDLRGVGVDVGPGESLAVEFSTAHPMYADNADRQPSAVALEDLKVSVPEVGAAAP